MASIDFVDIASPAPALSEQLRLQTTNSSTVYENLGKLQRLRFTEDMVAYVDPSFGRKTTLLEVIDTIRKAYTQTAAKHYETVNHLSTLALIQETRINSLAKGRINAAAVVKGVLMSVAVARQSAERAKTLMAGLSPEIKSRLQTAKSSILEIQEAIAAANTDEAREKFTGIIVKKCVTGFATGSLVATAAHAASSGAAIASIPAQLATDGVEVGNTGFPNDVPIQKHVEAVQKTWMSLHQVMRSTRDDLTATQLGKALFNKLSVTELSTLLQLLKIAVIIMEGTLEAVEKLTKPLEDWLVGLSGIADVLDKMESQCKQYQSKSRDGRVEFGKNEANVVNERWAEVTGVCQRCLDTFNAQGVMPRSFGDDDDDE